MTYLWLIIFLVSRLAILSLIRGIVLLLVVVISTRGWAVPLVGQARLVVTIVRVSHDEWEYLKRKTRVWVNK